MQREAGLVLLILAIPLAVFGSFGLVGNPRQVGPGPSPPVIEARKPEPKEQFPPDLQNRIPFGHRGVNVRGSFNPSETPALPGTRVDVLRLVPDPDIPGIRRAELVVPNALVLDVIRKKNELPIVALAMPLDQAVNLVAVQGSGPLEFQVKKEPKPAE